MSIAGILRKLPLKSILVIALLIGVGLFYFVRVYSDQLLSRSLTLDNNLAAATAAYNFSFTVPASEMLGAVKFQICANDPLFSDPCVAPVGLNVAAATLSDQSGATGFAIETADTNANTLVITRSPASIAAPVVVSYTFSGIMNPTSQGSYYGRLQTFPGNDILAPENDHGGLAFSINSAVQISATVPPYLLFCGGLTIPAFDCDTASGDYINFGNFSSVSTSTAQSQLLAATNGPGGYQIQVYGSTMTSGNNIISPLTARDVSKPSTSQFGLNLTANQTPSVGADPQGPGVAAVTGEYAQPDWFKFSPGDTLAGVATSDSYRRFTVSYIVNTPNGQTPGVYVATLTYICLANF